MLQQHLVPSFPTAAQLSTLASSSFCVVLASWRRMLTPHASNTNFTVNVASYAPKAPYVKRVRIVDLDLPASQQLVDAAWNRVYFDQGFAWRVEDVGGADAADARTFTLYAAPSCECTVRATVVLPFAMDAVTSANAVPSLGASAVRITLAHRAPTPIVAISAVFEALYAARCGVLELVGVPGLGTLPLTADSVADCDAMSFVIHSAALVTALANAHASVNPPPADVDAQCGMYLRATPIPGPSALATLVSHAATQALRNAATSSSQSCRVGVPACDGDVDDAVAVDDAYALPPQPPPTFWGVDIQYSDVTDRFTLHLNYPRLDDRAVETEAFATVGGGVAYSMGFGSALQFALPRHGAQVSAYTPLPGCSATRGVMFAPPSVTSVSVCAPSPRVAAPGAYAVIEEGSPATAAEFVSRLNEALNRFSWPAFSFGVVFWSVNQIDGTLINSTVEVRVPGGNMDLETAAIAIGIAVNATLGTPFMTVAVHNGGIMFESTQGQVFGLDWTYDAAFDPARVGYDRIIYGAASAHWPPHVAPHIPSFGLSGSGFGSGCAPPTSRVVATYRAVENRLVITPTPFPPFTAKVHEVYCGEAGALYEPYDAPPIYKLVCVYGYQPGLLPGARVALEGPVDSEQQLGVVVAVASEAVYVSNEFLQVLYVLRTNASLPSGAPQNFALEDFVVVMPLDASPTTLYMQAGTPHVLPADILGLDVRTYEVCTSLTAPGTLDVRQDPFVIVALSFQAGDTAPLTGDVYYPIPGVGGCTSCAVEGSSATVFAKVPRSVCYFRADFERLFDHVFEGAGIRLGYIHVRILNPNFTLYQAHGHPVSLTLRFDVRQSYVGLGESVGAPVDGDGCAGDGRAGSGSGYGSGSAMMPLAPPSVYSGQPLLPPVPVAPLPLLPTDTDGVFYSPYSNT
jgi:hypothetical protein